MAEDNKINQGLLTYLFTEWNIRCNIVENGKQAVEQLKQQSFDLVLMDIQMPEMDGYTAAKHIRKVLHLDIPIIAMTAHTMEGEREKCLGYGMNEHIAKPIRENHLYNMIALFVNMRKAKNNKPGFIDRPVYQTIDLAYLKEISNGNIEYEQTITEEFIKQVPQEILTMNDFLEKGDYSALKKTVHNMKTTIAVMGLNSLLEKHLDAIENNNLTVNEMRIEAGIISFHLKKALTDADLFLQTMVGHKLKA